MILTADLVFGTPFPSELLQPIGESSPMGLLWKFMGSSIPYVIFTGAAEVLGGLLLAARRTTLLGALVCIGVLSNVVMLNLSYDVPVKLYSSHLLLMAIFLAAPDLRRLASLFVWNRRVPPAEQRPLFASRQGNRAALVFRTVFILYVTVVALHESYESKLQFADVATRQRLYGAWEVEELAVDGVIRPRVRHRPRPSGMGSRLCEPGGGEPAPNPDHRRPWSTDAESSWSPGSRHISRLRYSLVYCHIDVYPKAAYCLPTQLAEEPTETVPGKSSDRAGTARVAEYELRPSGFLQKAKQIAVRAIEECCYAPQIRHSYSS